MILIKLELFHILEISNRDTLQVSQLNETACSEKWCRGPKTKEIVILNCHFYLGLYGNTNKIYFHSTSSDDVEIIIISKC